MSKNDWTNILRNQLADHQEPVSHDLWAEIEQSLAQPEHVNKTGRVVMWKRWSAAAAVVALLGAGSSYVYFQSLQHESSVALVAKKGGMPGHGGNSQSSQKNLEAQNSGNNSLATLVSLNQHPSVGASKPAEILSVERGAVLPVASTEEDVALASAENIPVEETAVLTEEAITASEETTPEKKPRQVVASAPDLYEPMSLASHDKKQEMDWTIGLYATNLSVTAGNGINQDFVYSDPMPGGGSFNAPQFMVAAVPIVRKPRYVEAKHHVPLSIGAQVGIGVSPRLSLNTGLVYTRTVSDFMTDESSDYNVSQVLHYVGVPLSANYEVFRTGSFHVYMMAGGEIDFNVKNDTKTNGVQEEDVKRDRPQVSGKVSLGAQYDVAPHVGLYIEPGAKYYFDNRSRIENTFKDKKWNYHFQFGLRFNVK